MCRRLQPVPSRARQSEGLLATTALLRLLSLPRRKGRAAFLFFTLLLAPACPLVFAAPDESADLEVLVEAFDIPGDSGDSIGLSWLLGHKTVTAPGNVTREIVKEHVWSNVFPEQPGSSYRILVSERQDLSLIHI